MFPAVLAFMQHFTYGNGWIIKAPYVQNGVGFRPKCFSNPLNIRQIIERAHTATSSTVRAKLGTTASDCFEYLMIQPCVPKNNEAKIILMAGKPRYITSIKKSGLRRLHKEEEMLAFAEKAIDEIRRTTNDAFLWEGISRVDLFSVNGQLVVNEFENLSSQYSYVGKGSLETILFNDLSNYYQEILAQIIKSNHF